MNPRTRRPAILIVLGIAALYATVLPAEESADRVLPLLSTPETGASSPKVGVARPARVRRSRLVRLDLGALAAQAKAVAGTGEPAHLWLQLFDDLAVEVEQTRVDLRGTDSWSWFGRVVGAEGQVLFVSDGDQLIGRISIPEGYFQLRPTADGLYEVIEIEQSLLPPPGPPRAAPGPASAPGDLQGAVVQPAAEDEAARASAAAASGDTTVIIDVLIAYTASVRSASENIMLEIQAAIDDTNQAYRNSQLPQRIRLVGTAEVGYRESGDLCDSFSSDLDRLRGTSDGYMDEIHSLRTQYGADLVQLWVERGQYCGCAFQMQEISSTFRSSGFGVVLHECALAGYTVAHELGHNMGARHDCWVDNIVKPYAYAHGYVSISERFITIMSYQNKCQAYGVSCRTIPYFSDPDLRYGGVAIGNRSSGCSADNSRILVASDGTVASFLTGACIRSGYIERVVATPGLPTRIDLRSDSDDPDYTYFTTSDPFLGRIAARAQLAKVRVEMRGNRNCPAETGTGGALDQLTLLK